MIAGRRQRVDKKGEKKNWSHDSNARKQRFSPRFDRTDGASKQARARGVRRGGAIMVVRGAQKMNRA